MGVSGIREGLAIQWRMLLMLRKTLFYILLVLYLVITPYMILYGLGYVVKPHEREIRKTGLVAVTSDPKGASIYVEGRKFSEKTPSVVRGLLPGTYQVKVAKRGFEPWDKEIHVLAEKAVRLDPVILMPRAASREVLTQGGYRELFPYAGEFKIYGLGSGQKLSDLAKIELLFNRETALAKEKETPKILEFQITEWKTKKDSASVLLKGVQGGEPKIYLYDLNREKIRQDLTGIYPENGAAIDWDSKKPRVFYYLKDHQLYGLDFSASKVSAVGGPDTLGFGAQGGKVYILRKDFSIWQSGPLGQEPQPLSKRDDTGARLFSGVPAKSYRVEVMKRELFQKELVLFQSDRGALLSNWPPYRLADEGVLGFRHLESGDLEKILYWTAKEIGIFNFAFNAEEEETIPPRMVLYRAGKKIRQAFWAYEGSHIIFQDGAGIFLLEAGDQAPYHVREIERAASGTAMLYQDRTKSIFYIDPENRNIIKRKLTE